MKIVFKGENFVKMYEGQLTYEEMVNFAKTNFNMTDNFNLCFVNDGGESIMITSQADVESMKKMCQ